MMFRKNLFAGIALEQNLGPVRNTATILLLCGLVGFYLSLFLPVSYSFSHKIFTACVFLPLLIATRRCDLRKLHGNLEINTLCLLLIYLLCSHGWSIDATRTQIEWFTTRAAYIYTLIVAIYLLFSRIRTSDATVTWLIGMTVLCIATSMVFFYSSRPLTERFEAYGRFNNANAIAIYSAGLCAVAFARMTIANWRLSLFLGIASAVFIACIVFTHSRSGLIALAAACGFVGLRLRRWQLAAATIIAIAIAPALLNTSIWTERGFSLRDGIWLIDWIKLQSCGVLFGCGLSTHSGAIVENIVVPHIHSIPFGMLFHGGIVALSIYLFLIFHSLYRGLTQPTLTPPAIVLLAGSAGTLVTSHQLITSAGPIWVYLLAPLILLALHRPTRAPSTP